VNLRGRAPHDILRAPMRPIAAACLALAALLAVPAAHAAPVTYPLDADHTFPSLEFPHMGLSVWRGKFNRTTGTFRYDAAARTGSVEVVVDAKSIDFGHDAMNEHAQKPDWLDTARYPDMTYRGRLRWEGERPVAVDGELTLRGVTRPLVLRINRFACIEHPYYKREACGADAEAELDRALWGMTQYTQDGAGILKLRIQVEALAPK
jgi:polyisoprenoid-binding protein YceI